MFGGMHPDYLFLLEYSDFTSHISQSASPASSTPSSKTMASRRVRSQSPLPNTTHVSPCSSQVQYDPENTGRDTLPHGQYHVGMFDSVESLNDFAAALCVPIKVIPLIESKDIPCMSIGCIHNAIKGNHDYCPAHYRRWYPLRHEKGGDLRGLKFTKFSSPGRGCDCD